ncbi:MAG: transketolase [Ignavibacteria bacterium]|nr:transketolase [Ignavibacteria bacterium]
MNELLKFDEKLFKNQKRKAQEFEEIAIEIRRDIIKMLFQAKSGHSGGPLGIADIFAVLFFGAYMNYKAEEPSWKERDRFILSSGHYCPVLYSALARAGFYPVEEMATLRKFGSRLQGHPGRDMGLPGIEASTGSLGQGISIAVGMAISDKYLDKNEQKVFCLTGDGELQEGSCWEAAMAASNYKLDNLCWIVDNNDCQIDGRVQDVMNIYPLDEKFKSFGFNVIVCDGHNFEDIISAFEQFSNNSKKKIGKPCVIIAETKMGRAVSFMEDKHQWHGNPPNEEQALIALKELK